MLSSTRKRLEFLEWEIKSLRENAVELRSIVFQLAEAMSYKVEYKVCDRDGYRVTKKGGEGDAGEKQT